MKKDEMKKFEAKAFDTLVKCGAAANLPSWGAFANINDIKTEWCTKDGYIKLGIGSSKSEIQEISFSLFRDNIPHIRRKGSVKVLNTTMEQFERVINSMKALNKLK
jgi:hypothetical protein